MAAYNGFRKWNGNFADNARRAAQLPALRENDARRNHTSRCTSLARDRDSECNGLDFVSHWIGVGVSVESQSMSLRVRFTLRFLIGAVCLLSTAAMAGEPQTKKTPFGTGTEVGSGLIKYHRTCVFFRVLFISSDFFKDWQGHKTLSGIEFRKKKNKATYASFPDSLIVDVEATPWKCGTTEMTPPEYVSGLMEAPSFEVSWKNGDETRRVELLATEEHHHALGLGWSYLLTVPSASVPLTDSLVINVSLRHGTCQTLLTANLDAQERRMIPNTCD
jgi:hypothetical protein